MEVNIQTEPAIAAIYFRAVDDERGQIVLVNESNDKIIGNVQKEIIRIKNGQKELDVGIIGGGEGISPKSLITLYDGEDKVYSVRIKATLIDGTPISSEQILFVRM